MNEKRREKNDELILVIDQTTEWTTDCFLFKSVFLFSFGLY